MIYVHAKLFGTQRMYFSLASLTSFFPIGRLRLELKRASEDRVRERQNIKGIIILQYTLLHIHVPCLKCVDHGKAICVFIRIS